MKNLKIFLLLSMFPLSNHMAAQWELLAPLDTTWGNLYTKFFNDSTGVVASLWFSDFQLMKTSDYGNTWDTIYTGAYASDVFFVNEWIGYKCSYNQPILKTNDGGYSWFNPNQDQQQEFTLHNLFFLDEFTGYGVFTGGGNEYAETADGGFTWYSVNENGGKDVYALDDCKRFIATNYHLRWNSDCINDWSYIQYGLGEIESYNAWSLWFANEQTGLICGDWDPNDQNNVGAFIAKTDNSGQSFISVVQHQQMYQYSTFEFINSEIGFCGGYGAQAVPHSLLKTTDGGNTWGWQEAEIFPTYIEGYGYPQFGVTSISCPSEDTCYAVGVNGAIWRTFNGGGPVYELPVSIQEQTARTNIKIYPNPAQSTVTFEGIKTPIKECTVYDNTGRIVALENNLQSNTLNVEKLNAGMYYVSIKEVDVVYQLRFVKE